MTSNPPATGGGFFSQPKAVWAVAFAAVVSFMGLGLVDPILPAIAKDLDASPSQVELLFTSYFAFTGISMLVTSAVASRIGAKRTLLSGLVLIIAFSALAGASDTIGAIVGLRAGWGLGNALFIATALSVIIGSASGGVAGAVMLYEAALGLGISLGPLVGGELGAITWRGPFFGVAVLMTIALIATAVFLDRTPAPPARERISVLDPLRALRHRATRGSGIVAIFYNFGFFTLLAYTPFPLGLGIHQLGYVFCGWGVMLAVFAVFVAPRVSRRFGDVAGLAGALAGLAVKPGTPLEPYLEVLREYDTLLVMTVEPGFGGQEFRAEVLPKVREARRRVESGHLRLFVEVDGGVNEETILAAAEAGADVFVAGSAVYAADDPARVVDELRARAAAALAARGAR